MVTTKSQKRAVRQVWEELEALPAEQREEVLARLLGSPRYRKALEEIGDRLVIERERTKPSRPLREYIAERLHR